MTALVAALAAGVLEPAPFVAVTEMVRVFPFPRRDRLDQTAHDRCGRSCGGTRHTVETDSFFFPLDSVQDWNRIYGRRGFLQHQSVVPAERAHAAFGEILGRVAHGSPVPRNWHWQNPSKAVISASPRPSLDVGLIESGP
jgi:hypothetical protein